MDERGFFLLTYDIAANKRRAKIAKAMEAVGERVQFSVFEAYLTRAELEKLMKKVQKLLDAEQDSVRVYGLCGACKGKVKHYGRAEPIEAPGLRIV